LAQKPNAKSASLLSGISTVSLWWNISEKLFTTETRRFIEKAEKLTVTHHHNLLTVFSM